MASASLTRLQAFFRTLFQFDLADLDFGIYRLFRLEQAAIAAFIDEDLQRAVDDVFAHDLAAENAPLHDELAAATAAIAQQLAADAILPTGELKPEYRQSQMHFVRELAVRYETARTRLQAIQAGEGHKAEVFNHLVAFFDRYYDAGDFIPKRRCGARSLRRALQRRRGLLHLGQPRPALRQERRTLPRLCLHRERSAGRAPRALHAGRGGDRARQHQGQRPLLLSAARPAAPRCGHA